MFFCAPPWLQTEMHEWFLYLREKQIKFANKNDKQLDFEKEKEALWRVDCCVANNNPHDFVEPFRFTLQDGNSGRLADWEKKATKTNDWSGKFPSFIAGINNNADRGCKVNSVLPCLLRGSYMYRVAPNNQDDLLLNGFEHFGAQGVPVPCLLDPKNDKKEYDKAKKGVLGHWFETVSYNHLKFAKLTGNAFNLIQFGSALLYKLLTTKMKPMKKKRRAIGWGKRPKDDSDDQARKDFHGPGGAERICVNID